MVKENKIKYLNRNIKIINRVICVYILIYLGKKIRVDFLVIFSIKVM